MSSKYQVDPFWVTSVVWTESHFRNSATSHVGAQGLMQVMPATGKWLQSLMTEELSGKKFPLGLRDPALNIELGVFYLKRLLNRFHGSYKFATVSYNMGPNWVSRRLRMRGPVGVKNEYLDKVKKYYAKLTRKFVRAHTPASYRKVDNLLTLHRTSQFNLADKMYFAIRDDFSLKNLEKTNYVLRDNSVEKTFITLDAGVWRPRWSEQYLQLVTQFI